MYFSFSFPASLSLPLSLSPSRKQYTRYRALFALRDAAKPEPIAAALLRPGEDSALVRHELAFVLGQLAHEAAVPALVATLENAARQEHSMSRHEAAEALGACAAASADARAALQRHVDDADRAVRESVHVALDIAAHAESSTFQYADGLAA